MLSKERAEFMVDVLQKELYSLERKKECIASQGVDVAEEKYIINRMLTIKRNLKVFRNELIKMIKENADFVVDDVVLSETYIYKSEYNTKTNSIANNVANRKLRTGKVKYYHL